MIAEIVFTSQAINIIHLRLPRFALGAVHAPELIFQSHCVVRGSELSLWVSRDRGELSDRGVFVIVHFVLNGFGFKNIIFHGQTSTLGFAPRKNGRGGKCFYDFSHLFFFIHLRRLIAPSLPSAANRSHSSLCW